MEQNNNNQFTMEDIYAEQLPNEKADLDLMTAGVIATAGSIIINHVEAATDDKLTLTDVCRIADTLNKLLKDLHRKQSNIEFIEKRLEDERSKKTSAEAGNDNHE